MRPIAMTVIVLALCAPQGALAQQPPAAPVAPAPPAAAAPVTPPAPAAPSRTTRAPQAPRPVTPAPAPAPAPPAPVVPFVDPVPGQLINIQLDILISEEGAGQATVTKTVTLTVADRQSGSSRAVDRSTAGVGILNVDVTPTVQSNGRILTRIGLEYQNATEQPSVQMRAQPLLESGRMLRVARSASARGDRTVTVDVTATILK